MGTHIEEPKTTCSDVFHLYRSCAVTKYQLELERQALLYAPRGTKGAVTKWEIETREKYMKENDDCRKLKKLLKLACDTSTQT